MTHSYSDFSVKVATWVNHDVPPHVRTRNIIMTTMAEFFIFALGALALIASPGPDFFYVATRALAQGWRAGVLSALGISLGLLFHTGLATLGLTVLLQTSATAFNIVKWIGAIYLVYIGVKSWIEYSNNAQALPPIRNSMVVRQAFLTNVFNPKAALTFAAFLPQFVHAQNGDAQRQIALLGLALTAIAALWFSIVGLFAGSFGARLLQRPRVFQNVQRASGIVMILLGIRLAFVSRV